MATALVTRDCGDADCIKDQELGEKREQHAIDNQQLEDSFKNLYLDEDEAAGGAPGTQ